MQSRSKVWTQPATLLWPWACLPPPAPPRPQFPRQVAGAQKLEIGDSQPGNYLSALIASADRDTLAAEVYYREALRADPEIPIFSSARSPRRSPMATNRAPTRSANGCSCAIRATAWRASQWRFTISNRDNSPRRGPTWRRGRLASARCDDRIADGLVLMRDSPTSGTRSIRSTAFAIPSVAGFSRLSCGTDRQFAGNPTEAQRRLKSAYDNDKNSLRFADAYARVFGGAGRHSRSDESLRGFLGRYSSSSADRARACGPEGESSSLIRSFMTRRKASPRRSTAWEAPEAARGTNSSGARLSATVALPSARERSDRSDAGQPFRATEAGRSGHRRLSDGAGLVAIEVGRRYPDRARTRCMGKSDEADAATHANHRRTAA